MLDTESCAPDNEPVLAERVLELPEEEKKARFDELQQKLVPLWKSIARVNQDPQTIVVVPSLTVDTLGLPGAMLQAYEERFLFLLLLLRQPRARMIYVTSQAILPSIVDYYLALLPGVIPSHARQRLSLIAPLDGSDRSLTEKLLDRPRLLGQIRSLIVDPDRAHLVPWNVTDFERDLALELGIPLYGADPRHLHFGTKSGCRRLFASEDVAHPLGREGLNRMEDLVSAIAEMRAEKPELEEVLVKLNEGISGRGNALVDLRSLPPPGDVGEAAEIGARVRSMSLEYEGLAYDSYVRALGETGGVAEERITGEELRSPSVQLRVTPLGEVELLSTHDQILGGPTGQSYFGCRFPADPAYASTITREAAKVGARLAAEGVLGRLAIDFVTVRERDGAWTPYAIEVNLRKGGTTHPFLSLQFLTDGTYDPETAVFTTPGGRQKCLVASDHVVSTAYRTLSPDDLFDIVARYALHFDQSRQTGVVLNMMSALGECGLVGMTAVGNSHDEADAVYQRTVAALDAEAQEALGSS
jgi:PGM1 C-terminal domain